MSPFFDSREAYEALWIIWRYLAQEGGAGLADRIEAELFEAFEQLARTPGIGHRSEDLTGHPFFFFAVYQYLIVYRRSQPLEIFERELAECTRSPLPAWSVCRKSLRISNWVASCVSFTELFTRLSVEEIVDKIAQKVFPHGVLAWHSAFVLDRAAASVRSVAGGTAAPAI